MVSVLDVDSYDVYSGVWYVQLTASLSLRLSLFLFPHPLCSPNVRDVNVANILQPSGAVKVIVPAAVPSEGLLLVFVMTYFLLQSNVIVRFFCHVTFSVVCPHA